MGTKRFLAVIMFGMPSNEFLVESYQKTKDSDVLEQLIKACDRLIHSRAHKFYRSDNGIEMADLYCEGRLGFITAISSYDASTGVLFSTYVTKFIDGYIYHYIRDKTKIVSVPSHLQEKCSKISRLIRSLGFFDTPTPEALSAATGKPVEECLDVLSLYSSNVSVISYDAPMSLDEHEPSSMSLIDAIGGEKENMAEHRAVCKAIIEEYLKGDCTMISLGNRYSITHEAVKNILVNRRLFGFS